MKPSFAVVGCGKVGTALGVSLVRAGYSAAGVASKSLSSAKQTAETIQAACYSKIPWEITRKADLVFITTPDSAIQEVCDSISQNRGFANNAVVLHCSGALPSTLLFSAKNCGAVTGSMHPLQSFASVDVNVDPFSGIVISIEGEDKAILAAKEIATHLKATAVTIRTEAKTLYHASAVTASNYLVTLIDLALRLLCASGIADRDAFHVLKPLIEGTLSNIEKTGTAEALTGPIVRGDVETVEKHVEEIGAKLPELLPLYKAFGFYTIDIASNRGAISESCTQALKKLTLP